MSVELLDTPRFHGFRVRRQIDGKTYQEYFSLKEGGKRIRGAKRNAIKAQAGARDRELAELQSKAKDKAAREVHVDEKGRVRGILFRMKTEKSGSKTPVFQIGIMSTLENKIVNTTVSINLHGLDGAWTKAIDFYAQHKKISKQSKAYRDLKKAKPSEAELQRLTGSRAAAGKAPRKSAAAKKKAPGRKKVAAGKAPARKKAAVKKKAAAKKKSAAKKSTARKAPARKAASKKAAAGKRAKKRPARKR